MRWFAELPIGRELALAGSCTPARCCVKSGSDVRLKPPLEDAGISVALADGSPLSLDPKRVLLTVKTKHGDLVFVPSANAQGRIKWTCTNGEGLKATQLPPSCGAASGR